MLGKNFFGIRRTIGNMVLKWIHDVSLLLLLMINQNCKYLIFNSKSMLTYFI